MRRDEIEKKINYCINNDLFFVLKKYKHIYYIKSNIYFLSRKYAKK